MKEFYTYQISVDYKLSLKETLNQVYDDLLNKFLIPISIKKINDKKLLVVVIKYKKISNE